MSTSQSQADPVIRLRRKLTVYRIVLGICILALVGSNWCNFKHCYEKFTEPPVVQEKSPIPHYPEVMQLINRLSYSGFQILTKPETDLVIDFKKKTWTLKNIHRFDAEGHVMLEDGRFGLCGQLADYVYRQIKPMFGSGYDISFERVAEVGFFLNPKSSHYILRVTELGPPRLTFFIDPSLGRYGRKEAFENYAYFGSAESLTFSSDATFEVPSATPVIIKKGFLIDLGVDLADERFDNKNFTLTLSATKQYSFSGRYILGLRISEGRIQDFENHELADWLIGDSPYKALKKRLVRWFAQNVSAANPNLDAETTEQLRTLAERFGVETHE